jgi:hypothetical protein
MGEGGYNPGMGLAGLLIVLGIIIWLLVNPLIGIVMLVIGLALLLWAGAFVGGGARRYWY